jgi:hypothetical protein
MMTGSTYGFGTVKNALHGELCFKSHNAQLSTREILENQ